MNTSELVGPDINDCTEHRGQPDSLAAIQSKGAARMEPNSLSAHNALGDQYPSARQVCLNRGATDWLSLSPEGAGEIPFGIRSGSHLM